MCFISTSDTGVFSSKFARSVFITMANMLRLIPTTLIHYFVLFNYPRFFFSLSCLFSRISVHGRGDRARASCLLV